MDYSKVELPEKLPDRVFLTETGNYYRVRINNSDRAVVKASPNIDPTLVAPVDIVLVLSIALVDSAGSVLRAGDKLRISDRHEIGPINVAAVNDIPALIDHEIGKMIEESEAKLVGVPEAMQLLTDEWGINFSPPPAYVPAVYLPAPVEEEPTVIDPDDVGEPVVHTVVQVVNMPLPPPPAMREMVAEDLFLPPEPEDESVPEPVEPAAETEEN